jgi:5-methylcytosine-specific restriction endonuclease McrA
MVKFMPIDRSSMDMISPIIDFTGGSGSANPYANKDNSFMHQQQQQVGSPSPGPGQRIVKRSVSETKKKYVASNQNWKCGHCGKQLNAWFEVDHKIRLDNGGSNEVQNLVALCRECHGEKTAKENM